jgi:phosphoenolpyruvate synthase/pyruvate phosphate dikinase
MSCGEPETVHCPCCRRFYCGTHGGVYCEQCSARHTSRGSPELHGRAAATGVARGAARVLTTLGEADRFSHGDVLVARTFGPAWTPLMALACAVVMETGGVLSPAAIVAREYGIPAVVSVVDATQLIRNGQLVEVDGDAGIVRLISA